MSLTPLMRQYYDVKAQYPDCILFFRMGDFYELFEDDAVVAARVLGITLTTRNNGAAEATPLCGFPYHAAERYVPRMISAGYRVAICEQVEDPKLAKGIVKREVVEVISAGTAMSESNLEAKAPNYICALLSGRDSAALAVADVTTGYFAVAESSLQSIESELYRRSPKELLVARGSSLPAAVQEFVEAENVLLTEIDPVLFSLDGGLPLLLRHFHAENAEGLGLDGREESAKVSAAALAYLLDQKKSELHHITRLDQIGLGDYMILDPATLRNLELVKPLNSDDVSGTLYSVLDYTVTAMGGRLLREWISHPLVSVPRIVARQECVAELATDPILLDELKESLREIQDMERLMGRVGSGRANARDLQGLGKSLVKAQGVSESIASLTGERFQELRETLALVAGRGEYLLGQLLDELPMTIREGGMIRPGSDRELDELNAGIKESREWLSSLEARERERLGISSLKVGYNKVFGYYIEVTQQNLGKVPADYIRKQTLANCERYITPEMKECETIILGAESRIHEQEYRIFCSLRDKVDGWRAELQATALAIAEIDSLFSLAMAARKRGYTRPVVHAGDGIAIHDGVHPVITALNPGMDFIANDVSLHNEATRLMLITGPNMAGKSTYLRQTGLIVLMAQIGSFVPAASAHIGVVDRIFTRVGASDRLSRGQSTFMVEMIETANILRHATPRSLVLLDEIGRGTSTFDGLSIAWAITETLHSEPRRAAKTLFATHYHELTSLIDNLEHAGNFRITVHEEGGKLLFLRKIVAGACDSSYGIHVAEMAGIPSEVVRRARRILLRLEKHQIDPSDARQGKTETAKPQTDLFAAPDENTQLLLTELRKVKPEEMTPLQALQFLADLKQNYVR